MKKEEQYILMLKDLEVLSFSVTFGEENSVQLINKLEHFDKAPYGVANAKDEKAMNMALFRFFNSRTISGNRIDYNKIIEATGVKDSFELSFKGHGLSLTNHYWYKKEGEDLKYGDINFFTNKWDDTFAKAVLLGDYEALKTADLNVPDIVTPGWAVKGWIYDVSPKLYKLGIDVEHPEEVIAEVLSSKIAKRLLEPSEVIDYELKTIGNRYASVSNLLIGVDEELIPLSVYLPFNYYFLYRNKNGDRNKNKEFLDKLLAEGYVDLYKRFVKIACLKSICFVSDLHFDNLSMIRNIKTGEIRISPLYDLGGAFGSSRSGREFISNINEGSLMLIYFFFSQIDKDWDYSWYDPTRLIDAEEVIRFYLSKSEFYTPEIIDNVIKIFNIQKSSLDEMANK